MTTKRRIRIDDQPRLNRRRGGAAGRAGHCGGAWVGAATPPPATGPTGAVGGATRRWGGVTGGESGACGAPVLRDAGGAGAVSGAGGAGAAVRRAAGRGGCGGAAWGA